MISAEIDASHSNLGSQRRRELTPLANQRSLRRGWWSDWIRWITALGSVEKPLDWKLQKGFSFVKTGE